MGGGVGGEEGEVEVSVGGGEGEGGGVVGHGWRVACGGGGVESGKWGGLGDGWDDGGAERVPGWYFMAIFERYLV